jgi:dTDP-4-dehydrorhamnose reductase
MASEGSLSARANPRPRILVLGGSGMLGHKLVQRLAARGVWVAATIRSSSIPDTPSARASLGGAAQILEGTDVLQDDMLERAIDRAAPDLVVNAVGVIKQLQAGKDPIPSIATNSLLPHRVAARCAKRGARMIHLSTDCVFSGRKGPYAEDSPPDAEDLYGRSKLLGEAAGKGCLTIRSSIVGRELRGRSSLIEWFLSQRRGRATGYARALYTGLTTGVMADLIGDLAINHPDLDGIWHVASEAISKYELLMVVNRHYGLGVDLTRDDSFEIDRRLDGRRFRAQTGFVAPSWDAMIAEMRADPTPYEFDTSPA